MSVKSFDGKRGHGKNKNNLQECKYRGLTPTVKQGTVNTRKLTTTRDQNQQKNKLYCLENKSDYVLKF